MKKKRILIAGAAAAILLCAALLISHLFRLEIVAMDRTDIFSQTSAEDESWKAVTDGDVVIENEHISLTMDSKTTHFTVTEKESGKTYSSVPRTTDGFTPKEEQQSEILLTYYDANGSKMTMNSHENSIAGAFFEVKTDGSAIRVYYSIRKSKQKIFVPTVFSQSTFEALLEKLENGPARRLKGFYTLNEAEERYVLNDSAGEHNYSEITGYMDAAGYTPEDYVKEAEKLGLDSSVSENMPAAFQIPVEYTLTENGFSAAILTDKITADSENYKLTNVDLLPYFGSCGYSERGFMMVPDGSGAIIELAEKGGITYSQGLWGNDLAVESSMKSTVMQNAGLPVFALHNGSEAFFAEVTGAAAVAAINAETFGNEITQSHIYANFNVRAYDSSDMGAVRKQAAFNIYASDYVAEFPKVSYTLFSEAETSYSDMANTYREQLIARGSLGERLPETDQVPVYLDFTGYETTDESFLGISVEGQTLLSTIEEIETALTELEKRGVTGSQVRLRAYANGGVYSRVSNGFKLNRKVGSTKELQALAQSLSEKGGTLYLENNISTVFETGNSFKKMTHAVRSLKKTVVEAIDYDLIARTREEAVNAFYITSPAYYDSLTENFIETLKKESDDISLYGYSWSDFGSKLYSDFHAATPYDRTQAMYAAIEAVQKAKDSFGRIITDGSNSYVLSEAAAVLNIPLRSSAFNSESYAIPFYQMVIHGYVDYSGAPMNTGGDLEGNYLAAVESGANLYYSFYTSREEPLKETQAGTLIYPTYITDSYGMVEEQYKAFTELFAGLRSQIIVSHERVAKQVFVTTYEDGTQITVNYGEAEETVNGRTIPAKGFTIRKGGDGE